MEKSIKLFYINLLQQILKTKDYLFVDYKDIDENTSIENLNVKKSRGSVRLISRKTKTPSNFSKEVDKFLATPLP